MLVAAVEQRAVQAGKVRMELCFGHGALFSDRPDLLTYYSTLGYHKGDRKPRDAWYDVLPEFREGLYFQQMVKMLNV
jgi:hypothetical protein